MATTRSATQNKAATVTSPQRGLAIWLLRPELAPSSPLDRVLVEACRPAGELLLRSKTADDFEQKLHQLLEEKSAAQGHFLLADALSGLQIDDELLGSQIRPQVREFLGSPAESILAEGLPSMEATFALTPAANAAPEERSAVAARRDQASTLGDQLDRLDAPPAVYVLLAEATLGNSALMALVYAIQRRMLVPDWLARLGAAKYVGGLRSTVRLFGSVPDARLSRGLLPSAERLRLETIEREYAEGRLGLRMLALRARAEGLAASFPFGGPVDDD